MFSVEKRTGGHGRPLQRIVLNRLDALFAVTVCALFLAASVTPAKAEPPAGDTLPAATAAGTVPISFLPPPIDDASYSIGIHDERGRLVRRLCEAAPETAFTAGLNGLITKWDRKDDAGAFVPAGHYSARGLAAPPLKVEGVAFHGNDWVSADQDLRITHVEAITMLPADGGLAVLATTANGNMELLRFSAHGDQLTWRRRVYTMTRREPAKGSPWRLMADREIIAIFRWWPPEGSAASGEWRETAWAYRLADGTEAASASPGLSRIPFLKNLNITAPAHSSNGGGAGDPNNATAFTLFAPYSSRSSRGRNGTIWRAGEQAIAQYSANEEILRKLAVVPGEPLPVSVAASMTADEVYLLEESDGWQRVRGISWIDTKVEQNQPVSTWQTFFERNIRRPDPALGLDDPTTAGNAPSPVVEITLLENPLTPGKAEKASLRAGWDAAGSYLETADGLRLRKISEQSGLRAVKLAAGKSPGTLKFYQTDGAAWEEFSIIGAEQLMRFDAGEFKVSGTGEEREKDAE